MEEVIENVKRALIEEGYTVVDFIVRDCGETILMTISKDGKTFILPIREQFYDTDSNGKVVKYHGEIRIDNTQWYKTRYGKMSPAA